MNEMPNLPTVSCSCYEDRECECGQTERALRAWSGGQYQQPMTSEQREWCLGEIDNVEGFTRESFVAASDADLARGVIDAWLDYCRDKGLC